MDKWVQLNNQAAGRDKIARLIQYAARAMWDSLESNNCHPALVDNFKTVEYILSTFRKCKTHCFYFHIIYKIILIKLSLQYCGLARALTSSMPACAPSTIQI